MITLLILLTVHFVADFVCQNDWMAQNKSKNNLALTEHVLVYGLVLFASLLPLSLIVPDYKPLGGVAFVAVTMVLHWLTDYFTSRVGAKLWFIETVSRQSNTKHLYPLYARFNDKRHSFFVWLGFDQLLHAWMLAGAAMWLL